MKNIIGFTLCIVTLLSSCQKKFDDMNKNEKSPTSGTVESLFANSAKILNTQVVSISVNRNVLKLWSQYVSQSTYINESNYDLVTSNISQNEWTIMYRQVLKGFHEASINAKAEGATMVTSADIALNNNKLAIIEIYTVYCYDRLVTIFGDVPYSEAFTETNLAKYDDAAEIQADLDKRLVAAIATMTTTVGSFDSGFDNLFGGDVAMWIKFANGLRLKMAINTADVNTNSKAIFNEVKDRLFALNESASFGFLVGQPNTNPMWLDLVNSERDDFVACKTIVDTMNSLNDPRISRYFQFPDPTKTEYVGGAYGRTNKFSDFSHFSDYFLDPTQPTILMDGMEMSFYLAEAATRNWGGDAKTHYDAAILQSVINWGGTTVQAQAYLAQPEVAYSATGGRNQVGFQAWLAYFNRGLLGWTVYRRLDITGHNGVNGDDLMNQAAGTTELTPKRYTYAINEQTLNGASYNQAVSNIGGDTKATSLWWDTK